MTPYKAASADPRIWHTKPGKGRRPFLSWQTVAGLLDRHAPGWTSATPRADLQDGQAVVTVALCLVGVTREGTAAASFTEIDSDGNEYAVNAVEHAERKAFKRAASLFGVGRAGASAAASAA